MVIDDKNKYGWQMDIKYAYYLVLVIYRNVQSIFWDMVIMHWEIHMQCGRHICSGAYINKVKYM